MLTWQELVAFERALRTTKVLSVYVGGAAADPAARDVWRRELRQLVEQRRAELRAAPHEERAAFDRCVARLEEALAPYTGTVRARGWMGVFAARPEGHGEPGETGRDEYAGPLPAPPPAPLVAWEDGMRAAPCVAALSAQRHAIVAVVDSRLARVHRWANDRLETLETLRAHVHVGPTDHMGYPPRGGFHTGTRGAAGADAADREQQRGTETMLHELADRLELLAGPRGLMLVGGIPEVAAAAMAALPERLRPRARIVMLDVHATDAQVGAAARRAAAEAREEKELEAVAMLVDLQAAGGRVVIGVPPVREALREHAVQSLWLSPTLVRDAPLDAEAVVRAAFDHMLEPEVVTGEAARRLDEAGGAGALLRFVPARQQLPLGGEAREKVTGG